MTRPPNGRKAAAELMLGLDTRNKHQKHHNKVGKLTS